MGPPDGLHFARAPRDRRGITEAEQCDELNADTAQLLARSGGLTAELSAPHAAPLTRHFIRPGCARTSCYSGCHCLSEVDRVPWHFASRVCGTSTMNEGVAPKLMVRMPPSAQRRNSPTLWLTISPPRLLPTTAQAQSDVERQICEAATRSGSPFIEDRLRDEHSRR